MTTASNLTSPADIVVVGGSSAVPPRQAGRQRGLPSS